MPVHSCVCVCMCVCVCVCVCPQAVDLMMAPRFQPVVLGLMYHLSMDDKFKSLFTYTECIPRVYEMLIRVQVSQWL